MQCDQKPMMRPSPGFTFWFTLLISISGRIHGASRLRVVIHWSEELKQILAASGVRQPL
jgi:hypothetical protein